MGHFRIGLELTCNGGSCGRKRWGGISLSRDKLHSHLQILPENKPQLQAKIMDKIPWSAYIM